MVQWLGLGALAAVGLGSSPGRGTKMPRAAPHGQKKKKVLQIGGENKDYFKILVLE